MTTTPKPTPAPTNDLWKRTVYQLGDGDIISATRPGSLDAFKLPSLYGNQLRHRESDEASNG